MKKCDLLLYEESVEEAKLFKEAVHEIGEDCGINIIRNGHEFIDYIVNVSESPGKSLPGIIIISLDEVPGQDSSTIYFTKTKLFSGIPVIVMIPPCSQVEIDMVYALGACSVIKKPKKNNEFKIAVECIWKYWMEFSVLPKKEVAK